MLGFLSRRRASSAESDSSSSLSRENRTADAVAEFARLLSESRYIDVDAADKAIAWAVRTGVTDVRAVLRRYAVLSAAPFDYRSVL